MNKNEFRAFQKAWIDVPSQDNEGYVPDRRGFKCGWFLALSWHKKRIKKLMKKAGGDWDMLEWLLKEEE